MGLTLSRISPPEKRRDPALTGRRVLAGREARRPPLLLLPPPPSAVPAAPGWSSGWSGPCGGETRRRPPRACLSVENGTGRRTSVAITIYHHTETTRPGAADDSIDPPENASFPTHVININIKRPHQSRPSHPINTSATTKVGIPNFVSGPREYIMEGEYVILAMCSWFRIS